MISWRATCGSGNGRQRKPTYCSIRPEIELVLGLGFGMIYVDYQTQRRILSDSAAWYRETIRANGENL